MNPALPIYSDVLQMLRYSEVFEKNANYADTLEAKALNDLRLFQLIKQAGIWSTVRNAAGSVARSPAKNILLTSAAATAPVALGGAYLVHRAGEEARDTVRDARNKALQTGLGLAAIGGGMYALHRATQSPQGQVRTASVHESPEELLQKLSATGYLSSILEDAFLVKKGHEQEKVAEYYMLNAEHAVNILQQLLN